LTLKKLTELANRHLLQLNGRYLIHKPNDKDLALEIIDQHHANNIRSIHTLSGGESFLVSLALALGLSDLAGRNTQIKSFGFGDYYFREFTIDWQTNWRNFPRSCLERAHYYTDTSTKEG